MTGFTNATDIANRALQRIGSQRIASGALLTETSRQATEAAACYDKLRRAELSRNVWSFATRRVILRAVGTALPDWVSTTTYASGAYVTQDSVNYKSLSGSNTGNDPSTDGGVHWQVFNGNTSLKVTFSAYAGGTTYGQGAVVTGSDNLLYQSMTDSNVGHDPTTDDGTNWLLYFGPIVATAYDSGTSYSIGELVFGLDNTIYASTMNANTNDPTTGVGWVTIGGSGSPIVIPWPAGTGPLTESSTRNVFVLPNGYLRKAPTDPTAGQYSFLGFPGYVTAPDWQFEGGLIVSRDAGPIMFRFVADVSQVSQMHDMFCEGLASRLAAELCEIMTNSATLKQILNQEYRFYIGEARLQNAIEIGPTQPYLDDLIACRV